MPVKLLYSESLTKSYQKFNVDIHPLDVLISLSATFIFINPFFCIILKSVIVKSGPSRNPFFFKYNLRFRGPEKKKSIARCGGGLRSCLRNRIFHEPRCAKTHLETPGLGLGQDLINGNFNFNLIQRK